MKRAKWLAFAFWIAVASANAQQGALQTLEQEGRPVATYYGVEPKMRLALDQLSEYYLTRHGQAFRVYEDHVMPWSLREMGYQPATALMQRWVREFFASQDPNTGLVASGGPARPSEPIFTILDTSQCMFLRTLGKAANFLEWFPDDPEVREQCHRLANGFLKYFRAGSQAGWFHAVRADTGFPESALVNVCDYGLATSGLTRMGKILRRQDLLDQAKQVAGWVSHFSLRHTHGMVPEKFHALGGLPNDISSDGIYWIRLLEHAYKATGDPFYRDLILQHGNTFFENAWSEEDQHFVTTTVIDATGIHRSGNMRGDTKYNYPLLLCLLTRLTGDSKYMERFDRLWETYQRESVQGWVPATLYQGHREARTGQPMIDPYQSLFLDILLDAFETTRNGKYLSQADRWLEKLLTPEGRAFWRKDCFGHTLIRYVRAHRRVARLEVTLPEAGLLLKLCGPDDTVVFQTVVPTPTAVLYPAPGVYTLRATGCQDARVELGAEAQKMVALRRQPR